MIAIKGFSIQTNDKTYDENQKFIDTAYGMCVYVNTHTLSFLQTLFKPDDLAEFNGLMVDMGNIHNNKRNSYLLTSDQRVKDMKCCVYKVINLLKKITIFHSNK